MKSGGNIFCTEKIVSNNSNLKPSEEGLKEDSEKNEDFEDEEGEKARYIDDELLKDERLRHFMLEMKEEDKDLLTCDEVFALYLRHVSKQVNEQYYRTALRFVLLYRECLNEYGWLKRQEHYHKAYAEDTSCKVEQHDAVLSRLRREEECEERQENERIAALKKAKKKVKIQEPLDVEESKEDAVKEEEPAALEEEEDIYIPQAEYTAVCNADFAPLVCNEFVTEFLDKDHGACAIDRHDAIELTRNFCYWVATNGLTCAHIGLN